MPLPLPNLDDRRWADLVEEGRALIPRYARSWTDHNIHDPGVMLVELFAWLAEMNIYQLNQIPERHLRKFLALLGFAPAPPRAAQTLLSFSPEPGTAPFGLRAGTVFETSVARSETIKFQTQQDLTIVEAILVAVQVDSGEGPRDRWRAYHGALPFYPFGPNPQPGAALYLGFDAPLPPAKALGDSPPMSVGLRFTGGRSGPDERARILRENRAQAEACHPPRPAIVCDDEVDMGEPPVEPGLPPHHSARTVWEFFAEEDGRWVTLHQEAGEVLDDTRSFTLDGTVRLGLPSAMAATTVGDVDRALYYLRCRMVAGQYDIAPQLAGISFNAVIAKQAIPAWQRFPITPDANVTGSPPAPGDMTRLVLSLDVEGRITVLEFTPDAPDRPDVRVLEYISPDLSTNSQGVLTLELVWLGRGTGTPDQQATMPQTSVLAENVALYSLEDTLAGLICRAWTWRMDLDASRRTDAHYTLDPTTGVIVWGNGERGLIPGAGALLLAAYETTQADGGNVPAETVTQLAEAPRNEWLLSGLPNDVRDQLSRITTNPAPVMGGAPAESLAHAIGRAVETLWAHERLQSLCERCTCQTLDQISGQTVLGLLAPTRAINTLDIERLALDVPGTGVQRARAWTNLHADYPCLKATGVVSLVILPGLPQKRPQPSEGLLSAVRRYLDRRRIITTRIEVVGPRYVEIRVQAQVQRFAGVDPERLATDIVTALDNFLDPLHGGPDRYGWPFGRDVYRTEIMQVIEKVQGVDYVRSLDLLDEQGQPECDNLCVGPTWLVTAGQHQIEVT